MRLVSVNIGHPREVIYKGKTVTTGIFKEPVEGRIGLRTLNLDGDAPHRPRGCIAQAWSVAELLRVAVQDVLGIKPARREVSAPAPESKPSRQRGAGRSR